MRAIHVKSLVIAAIILTVSCSLCTTQELVSPSPSPTPTPTPGTLREVVAQENKSERVTAKAGTPTELVVGLAGVSLSATEVAIASSLIVALVIGLTLVLWKLR